MKNFLHDKKRRSGRRTIIISVLAILGIVFFGWLLGIFRGPVQSVHTPFWKLSHSIGTYGSHMRAMMTSRKKLILENDQLHQQVLVANAYRVENTFLKQERDELLGVSSDEGEKKSVIARVLAWPFSSHYGTMVIDAGSAEGISVDDRVFVGTVHMLLGTVLDVQKNTSTVVMVTGPDREQEGILGGSNAVIPVVGRGGGMFEIQVPRGIEITPGIPVSTPAGDVFGVVETSHFDPRDPYQSVLGHTPISINQIRFVEVLLEH